MWNRATLADDADNFARGAHSDPIRVDTHEVRYLDISGCGVPDAVEHVTRRAFRSPGSDVVDTVEECRRLQYGIGVDGKPAGVAEHTSVFVRDSAGRFTLAPSGSAAA